MIVSAAGGGGGGSGDVTAAANFDTDGTIIRADGTGKGVQKSLWFINDSGTVLATDANGPMLRNVAATKDIAAIHPNRADGSAGVGGVSGELSLVQNSSSAVNITNALVEIQSGRILEGSVVGSYRLNNSAASATVPTVKHSQTDTSGVGGAGDTLDLITNNLSRLNVTSAGVVSVGGFVVGGVNSAHLFGDGFDGDVTLVGNTTLSRDMFYDSLDTDTFELDTNGFRVYCKTLCTVGASGSITANGTAASGATAGADGPTGTQEPGQGGGNGGTGAGTVGEASTNAITDGSNGGAGGAGSSGGGGAGGVQNDASPLRGPYIFRGPTGPLGGWYAGQNAQDFGRPGAGGGGGGGDGVNSGGGGGGGGNILVLCAKTIANSGTISANGGTGAAGVAGDSGGGGGGGGGVVVSIANLRTGNTPTASGGTAGAASGSGGAGTAGVVGTVVEH